jgi:hypothetical protein
MYIMARGIRTPLLRSAAHLPISNCPAAKASGWRRYVQAAKLKALRPNLSGCSNTPAPARSCAGAILIDEKRGMEMPRYNFKEPMTFLNALEQFSLALECAMVALRNEAAFHDSGDETVLNAAHLFCSLLEDHYAECVTLTNALEQRVIGAASHLNN